MGNEAFVAQLAQFSQVEGIENAGFNGELVSTVKQNKCSQDQIWWASVWPSLASSIWW